MSTPNDVNSVMTQHLFKFELLNPVKKGLRLVVQVMHHALEHLPLVVPGMDSIISRIVQVRSPVGEAFVKIFMHWGQIACVLKVIKNAVELDHTCFKDGAVWVLGRFLQLWAVRPFFNGFAL